MPSYPKSTLEEIVNGLQDLYPAYASLIERYRLPIDADPEQRLPEINRSAGYWRRIFFYDSLVRIRLLIENNFRYIETLGLLATTRYVFELFVWLKLMSQDVRYGHVYLRQLLETDLRHKEDFRVRAAREVSLLRQFAHEEEQAIASLRGRSDYPEALRQAAQAVDRMASRHFSIYSEQATKSTGYGFQAHLVEAKVLPELAVQIDAARALVESLEKVLPKDLQTLAAKWNWKRQAGLAGMAEEYEFIYTYTSRLLHATPVSITTDQKNLERDETLMFLKYVRVRLTDALELAVSEFNRWKAH